VAIGVGSYPIPRGSISPVECLLSLERMGLSLALFSLAAYALLVSAYLRGVLEEGL